MPTIAELLVVQYRQQEEIWGSLPDDRQAQRVIAKEIAAALDEERVEYLRAIAYKSWLLRDESDRASRLYELVDLLKCVLALMWTEDVSPDELWQMFLAKTAVVTERKTAAAHESFVSFDIDGVVCEHVLWEPTELAFVEAGNLLKLQPKQATIELMRELKAAGTGIVLVTSRKSWLYRQIEPDTYAWLRQHDVPFDALLWGYDKLTSIRNSAMSVKVAFEDKAKHALDLTLGGIPTVFMGEAESAPASRLLVIPADHTLESMRSAYVRAGALR